MVEVDVMVNLSVRSWLHGSSIGFRAPFVFAASSAFASSPAFVASLTFSL